jgi:hypothetical protein
MSDGNRSAQGRPSKIDFSGRFWIVVVLAPWTVGARVPRKRTDESGS